MKAITLTQPWATLVAIGAKRIETRSWPTNYRGPIAIHAAKGLALVGGLSGLQDLCATQPFRRVFQAHNLVPEKLPLGMVIATAEVVDVVATEFLGDISPQERAFGLYDPERYGWYLRNVQPLLQPVPAKGALGLWTWEPSSVGQAVPA